MNFVKRVLKANIMKPKSYTDKIRILVKCDLQNGNRHKIKALIPKLLADENYEALQGIKLANLDTKKLFLNK